jgi:hypothetical protein
MCRHHSALTEARNVNDLAVPAGEPQVDGMAAPVLSNFVVGVVVDRVRENVEHVRGCFFAFPDPFPGWLVFGGFCGGWWGLTL